MDRSQSDVIGVIILIGVCIIIFTVVVSAIPQPTERPVATVDSEITQRDGDAPPRYSLTVTSSEQADTIIVRHSNHGNITESELHKAGETKTVWATEGEIIVIAEKSGEKKVIYREKIKTDVDCIVESGDSIQSTVDIEECKNIYVKHGSYDSFTIPDDDTRVYSYDNPSIKGGVTIQADDVSVSGVSVKNEKGSAITVEDASNTTINHITVKESKYGFDIQKSNNTNISNTEIISNEFGIIDKSTNTNITQSVLTINEKKDILTQWKNSGDECKIEAKYNYWGGEEPEEGDDYNTKVCYEPILEEEPDAGYKWVYDSNNE